MDKSFPLEERSIRQLYLDGRDAATYMIPVYQRNYAWEKDEIDTLVKDVHDSFRKDRNSPYYIGTLVSFNRGDSKHEIIDGQQRLTTIYIILKALGITHLKNRLTYTARRISADTISSMPDFSGENDKGIVNGYNFAAKAIEENIAGAEKDDFTKYFLDNVRIIHYQVPKDVDLNHYFEVMNSRGEQLEKHEIVKSVLSSCLGDDAQVHTFCRIWEACSDMDRYVQQAFKDTEIFGKNLDSFPDYGFFVIQKQQDASGGKDSIRSLMEAAPGKAEESGDGSDTQDFQPIIDFPNFLLIVLKLLLHRHYGLSTADITLDDKELHAEFVDALKKVDHKDRFARLFARYLLQARYLLDNYIVHHSTTTKENTGENPWALQRFFRESSRKEYPKNLSDNDAVQQELVQLLSMFEVSYSPKQRKNYLFYCLLHLLDNRDVDRYLGFMRAMADKYFYDVYLNRACLNEANQPAPNAFDNAIMRDRRMHMATDAPARSYATAFADIYAQGRSDIPLFVFNYTDYRLWKKYADTLRGSGERKGSDIRSRFFGELGCSDFELETFKSFYFSRTRKSLEHFYPRAKAADDDDADGTVPTLRDINCFGNFAMIGADANSSGSNWDPRAKLEHYTDRKSDAVSVASLKFKIMMQKCKDNYRAMLDGELDRPDGLEWNYADMMAHQQNMLGIILRPNV